MSDQETVYRTHYEKPIDRNSHREEIRRKVMWKRIATGAVAALAAVAAIAVRAGKRR
ncbi:MAG: hypothetical protein ACLFV7_08520 [Phycisphaerae bacterium]